MPLPSDPEEGTLRRECARIALEVSTGAVWTDDQNLYHSFAAIKFFEFSRTLTRDEAQKATADTLFALRWKQPEMTRAQADVFAAQHANLVAAARQREGLEQAKDILSQMGLTTEDMYGQK